NRGYGEQGPDMGNEVMFTVPGHPDRRANVDNLLAQCGPLSSETYGICPVIPQGSLEFDVL
ncbi:MAG: hypothetical protein QG663_1322, partial [Thermodesulfobacteriota bacterium]|nr:hypothetical protein [Thermodesulfobacteriota bacterium]